MLGLETTPTGGDDMPRAERFTAALTYHGEGAGWDVSASRLRVVDMLAGDVVTIGDDGAVQERRHVGTVAAAWRRRSGGGLVVGTEHGFTLVNGDSVSIEAFEDTSIRMNEGACDPQGRFYCGSMAYDQRPGVAALWRLDPDRTVTRVADGLTVSNGLVWSLDGSLAYHVDTPTGRIDAWDFDPASGTLHDRRPVAEVGGGNPDGLTIDAEGGLWVALYGGSAVHRYTPEGALSEVVEVGATNVTSCAFGGPGLDRLFITTSRENAEDDPLAGSVFVAGVGVRGVPLLTFAG
jgi:sugar lactone lactonase YvrE